MQPADIQATAEKKINKSAQPSAEQEPRWKVRTYLVEVPFLTSQMLHLKASALFLKVHTLQSQKPSSAAGLACLFGLEEGEGEGKRVCVRVCLGRRREAAGGGEREEEEEERKKTHT